jgi:hypothetical protein
MYTDTEYTRKTKERVPCCMNGRDEGGNVITRKDVRENDGGGEPSL